MLRKGLLCGITVLLIAAGCSSPAINRTAAGSSQAAPTQEVVMESSSTPDVMMSMSTQTADAMMHEATPTEAPMMGETATPEAMMTEAMPNTGEIMAGTSTPEVMSTAEGSMMAEGTPTGMMAHNDWLSTALTDVRTWKSFRLNDFLGKTVLIELMGTQCTACLEQQKSIQAVLANGMGDVVVVSLDIVPDENAAILKDHIGMNTFSWTFAKAPSDMVMQIGQDFGSQYINAEQAPLLVIDPMGEVHALSLNLTNQNEIQSALLSYLH